MGGCTGASPLDSLLAALPSLLASSPRCSLPRCLLAASLLCRSLLCLHAPHPLPLTSRLTRKGRARAGAGVKRRAGCRQGQLARKAVGGRYARVVGPRSRASGQQVCCPTRGVLVLTCRSSTRQQRQRSPARPCRVHCRRAPRLPEVATGVWQLARLTVSRLPVGCLSRWRGGVGGSDGGAACGRGCGVRLARKSGCCGRVWRCRCLQPPRAGLQVPPPSPFPLLPPRVSLRTLHRSSRLARASSHPAASLACPPRSSLPRPRTRTRPPYSPAALDCARGRGRGPGRVLMHWAGARAEAGTWSSPTALFVAAVHTPLPAILRHPPWPMPITRRTLMACRPRQRQIRL